MTICEILSLISYFLALVSLYISGSVEAGSLNEMIFGWIGVGLIVLGALLAVLQNVLMPETDTLSEEDFESIKKMIEERRREYEQQELLKEQKEEGNEGQL